MNIHTGPALTTEERAERKAKAGTSLRANLWTAVWEANQVMTFDEIRRHVEGTLREIEIDAA